MEQPIDFMPEKELEVAEAKYWIRIHVTKTGEFRAHIKKNRSGEAGEVTVGGMEWKAGKFRQFHAEIVRRCRAMAAALVEKSDGFSSCPWIE